MGELSVLAEKTKNDPNRHTGVSSSGCFCGLVHDDELAGPKEKRDQIIEFFGGRCMNPDCRWKNVDGTLGCNDPRLFQIDHVLDDGFIDKWKRKNAALYYTKILQEIREGSKRYQLLCANCNWMKRSTTGAWALEFGRYKAERTRKLTKERKTKNRVQRSF